MKKRFEITLTSEQELELEERSKKAGFFRKLDYVRYMLFSEVAVLDRLNELHEHYGREEET
ncbi:MAG: hypothetical protein ACE5FT_04090 [Candidatus Nanoarchaeia archaeon]